MSLPLSFEDFAWGQTDVLHRVLALLVDPFFRDVFSYVLVADDAHVGLFVEVCLEVFVHVVFLKRAMRSATPMSEFQRAKMVRIQFMFSPLCDVVMSVE